MTTRGQINSNFYQIVDVDANANPTSIKNEFVANASVAHANISNVANSVSVGNVSGIGNIATINLNGNGSQVLAGNGAWISQPDTANANYANFAGTAFNVSGSNVTGTVGNATHATISDSANSVSVGNVVGIGNIATINLTGSTSNVLYGNGVFAPLTGSDYSNANVANFLPTYTGNISANIVTANLFSGSGANLTNITGANVTGTVGNATHATVSDSANSVAGSNVTGTVSNATHATVADSANSVAVANVVGIGNIATINLTGSTSNVLYGNGVFAPIIQDDANYANYANYANFAGNIVIAAQPNVTSLGNLVSMTLNNTVTPITANVGQMFWDTNEHTVTIGMENGVQQQVGLESYVYVKASAAITDGQVVMFTGANGENVLAAPADVTSVGFMSEYVIGVATQSIAHNSFGYITVMGKVHGLNTNSFNVGDILWLSTTTPGALVNVQPTDPAFQIQIAAVTKKSGGDGHIQVRVTPYWALTKLTDVTITTPTTGQALIYNGSNVWINGNPQQANIANVANSVAVANVVGIGNIATINLTGSTSNVLYGNGVFAAIPATTPGGANTQLQYNNNGSFGGISTVTYNGTNISLGSITTVKITGGSSGQVISTDGTGNLSWATSSGGGSSGFDQTFLLMGA